ncbi:hypothetical protein P7K49_007548, partial [Saguinus oedipus]
TMGTMVRQARQRKTSWAQWYGEASYHGHHSKARQGKTKHHQHHSKASHAPWESMVRQGKMKHHGLRGTMIRQGKARKAT